MHSTSVALINRQGPYCLAGEDAFQVLNQVVTVHGQTWAGRVICFKTRQRQLDCPLLARQAAGYRDPWLIVTDLAPVVAMLFGGTQADVSRDLRRLLPLLIAVLPAPVVWDMVDEPRANHDGTAGGTHNGTAGGTHDGTAANRPYHAGLCAD